MILAMNRRELFQSMAALGGAGALLRGQTPPGGAAAAADNGIRLGVATYSFRQFQRGLAIRMMRQMSIRYADVKEFHLPYNDTPAELASGRREFDTAGIQVIGGGNITLAGNDEAALRRYFDYARACRFGIMICAPTHENLPIVEKLAKEYDVRIAIHNHGPEDHHFPTPSSVLAAVKNMDPRMGLCIDIGHTARTGEDIVAAVAAAGPRLYEMHLKDLRDKSAKESQCVVGEGVLPIPEIFRELRKINYAGVCSLEYEIDEDDPLPGMQRSFAYMRGVLAGQKS
jgi:sugar phosphate isomerase/epimerase